MKSLDLALASRPQVLENCPVLGSRTALFFELLKFCGSPEKTFWKTFFTGKRLKKFLKTFFLRTLAFVSLILGLGIERFCPRKSFPWPRPWPRIFFLFLALASSLVSSTPPLIIMLMQSYKYYKHANNNAISIIATSIIYIFAGLDDMQQLYAEV